MIVTLLNKIHNKNFISEETKILKSKEAIDALYDFTVV